ncbi:hypothetical protein AOLI_G00130140 [Acnodon oligacanthus]
MTFKWPPLRCREHACECRHRHNKSCSGPKRRTETAPRRRSWGTGNANGPAGMTEGADRPAEEGGVMGMHCESSGTLIRSHSACTRTRDSHMSCTDSYTPLTHCSVPHFNHTQKN